MLYETPKYPNKSECIRNSTGKPYLLSSDISEFKIPVYEVIGGGKINCPVGECDLNGVDLTNVLTATTKCFIDSGMSGDCFTNIIWDLEFYENNVLVDNEVFYTSTTLNDVASFSSLTGSVNTILSNNNYEYWFNGSSLNIKLIKDTDLSFNIKTEINYIDNCVVTANTSGDTAAFCPSGYTASTNFSDCYFIEYTGGTSGTSVNVISGDKISQYGEFGTVFYENISNFDFPLIFSGGTYGPYNNTNFLVDSSGNLVNSVIGGPGSPYGPPSFKTELWGSGTTTSGRANNAGIKSNPEALNEWHGFAKCIDLPYSGVYHIGVSGDNLFRVKFNGNVIFSGRSIVGSLLPHSPNSIQYTQFHVVPLTLNSGKNIIELQYYNTGGYGVLAAEIYTADTTVLTGFTTESQLSGVTIFSTKDYIGGKIEVGETVGLICPEGYSADFCENPPVCSKITRTPPIYIFTGSCSGNTSSLCDIKFSGLTTGDTNVHIIDENNNDVNLTFRFIDNIDEFTNKNSVFYFEIYKYEELFGYFLNNIVYKSDGYSWEDISGSTGFTVSIPYEELNGDGNYLIKGWFIHDSGLFMSDKLGVRYKSPIESKSGEYSLYQKDRDYFLVSFRKSDKPKLTSNNRVDNIVGELAIVSKTLNGDETFINLPKSNGDYLISLNGVVLSKDIDYTLTSYVNEVTVSRLTLNTSISNGDILTYAYVVGDSINNLRGESYEITQPIVSGPIDGQGDEKVYYNTTKNKYEYYLDFDNIESNGIMVILNGVVLANGVDYYRSKTNPRRIIFEGTLLVGDILNVFYYTNTSVFDEVSDVQQIISWKVDNEVPNDNGEFIVEFATDPDFNNIITSKNVNYVKNRSGYQTLVDLVGSYGDTQYYRVKNIKKFKTICGEILETINYSDVVKIKINTNKMNSY